MTHLHRHRRSNNQACTPALATAIAVSLLLTSVTGCADNGPGAATSSTAPGIGTAGNKSRFPIHRATDNDHRPTRNKQPDNESGSLDHRPTDDDHRTRDDDRPCLYPNAGTHLIAQRGRRRADTHGARAHAS